MVQGERYKYRQRKRCPPKSRKAYTCSLYLAPCTYHCSLLIAERRHNTDWTATIVQTSLSFV